jgi:hypothetical protein
MHLATANAMKAEADKTRAPSHANARVVVCSTDSGFVLARIAPGIRHALSGAAAMVM